MNRTYFRVMAIRLEENLEMVREVYEDAESLDDLHPIKGKLGEMQRDIQFFIDHYKEDSVRSYWEEYVQRGREFTDKVMSTYHETHKKEWIANKKKELENKVI